MKIDGNKIKKIRLSLGKSQEEFGQLFNPPAAKSAVCRWEKGHGARKGRLKKIAKLAGVPVESLCPDLLAREQRNCPYCHVGSDRPTYPLFDGYSINNVTGKKTEITVLKDPKLPIFVPGLEDINYETEYDNSTPVMKYCPMCGRSLSGEDGRNERRGQR